jgi:RNA polymerase sigma-70 factor, ECF subfamily
MDIQTIINGCRRGDARAFELLFDRYENRVYDLAYTILGDAQEAQDAAQDAFIRILERLDSYQGEAAFETWLTAVVVNCCRDYMRRRKARRWLSLEVLRRGPLARQTGRAADPARLLEQNESRDALWQAVSELDDRLRIPFILRYRYNFACAEIGAMLGLTVNTIYDQLSQARRLLRASLEKKRKVDFDRTQIFTEKHRFS